VRPELPAGAKLTRLGTGAGGYWLASDRGLLVATSLHGPWRRASPPVGTSAIWAAAGSPSALYVAASAGILGSGLSSGAGGQGTAESAVPRAAVADPPESVPARSRVPVAADPPVAEVHRVAIGYLGLGRARLEALRGRVLNRGWWPLVAVRGDSDWDRRRTTDRDQSFLSGEVRHLTDRDRDRGDFYGVSLTLSWDLGDIAYEPEVIDVSRETREVIELRDDVLDEITQLYFERRRILAALAAADPLAADTTGLRLRAAELAAGIDAWTGGWFSERVNAPTP
jgi:hypothetical protein